MSIIGFFKKTEISIVEPIHLSFNVKNMHLLTEYDGIVHDGSKRLDAFKEKTRRFR